MTGVLLVMVFMPIGSNQFSANFHKRKFGKVLGALGNMILGALSGRGSFNGIWLLAYLYRL